MVLVSSGFIYTPSFILTYLIELYQNLQNSESDCFKRATLRLTNGCDGLQFGTQENMDCKRKSATYFDKLIYILNLINLDAIMLTLCELETAQIAIPVECKPLVNDIKDRNRHVENCIKYVFFKICKFPFFFV